MHPPVRLVAIDMDGTLLATFAKEVSRRNAQAIRAAQAAGITVVIATGRRTAYTTPLFDGVGLRAETPLITSNGAVTRTLGGEAIDRCHLQTTFLRSHFPGALGVSRTLVARRGATMYLVEY